MIYSGKDSKQESVVKVPKNIKQMGNTDANKKIYVEDNVMEQLNAKSQSEENIRYGVLLGQTQKNNGITYIFVKGLVQVKDIIEDSIIFNDDIWSNVYQDIKQYFIDLNVVGWYVSVPYSVKGDMSGIRKIHVDNFAGNDKICFLSDRNQKEEGFYIYQKGSLRKQSGFYIYFEKNENMKRYIKKELTPSDISEDKREDINENEKSFVANLKKTENTDISTIRQGRIAYGVSGLLIVALLLSTVVMLNNYGELKNIKQALSGINIEKQAQAVNQLLMGNNKETESESVIQETVAQTEAQTKSQMPKKKVVETEPPTEPPVSKACIVKAGQTLYDISIENYGTSAMVDKIKDYNDIDDDYTIIEGQKIFLP